MGEGGGWMRVVSVLVLAALSRPQSYPWESYVLAFLCVLVYKAFLFEYGVLSPPIVCIVSFWGYLPPLVVSLLLYLAGMCSDFSRQHRAARTASLGISGFVWSILTYHVDSRSGLFSPLAGSKVFLRRVSIGGRRFCFEHKQRFIVPCSKELLVF